LETNSRRVPVVVRGPRRVALRDHHVEVPVRLVAGGPEQAVRLPEQRVHLRVVEAGEIVVGVDVVVVQQDVQEVVRIRVVLVPADEGCVVGLALRAVGRLDLEALVEIHVDVAPDLGQVVLEDLRERLAVDDVVESSRILPHFEPASAFAFA
jgi:hypothetical protein